jgi:hypothetical protein
MIDESSSPEARPLTWNVDDPVPDGVSAALRAVLVDEPDDATELK